MVKSFFQIYIYGLCFIMLVGCGNEPPVEYNWNEVNGYRWSNLPEGPEGEPGFIKKEGSNTGLLFRNNLSQEDIFENRHYLNGSGVALGDVDGDGWTDIYLAQLGGPNKLYKNMGGFQFEDVTDSSGVAHNDYYSTGVSFADVDGDRDLDLFVGSMSRENVLYINDGQGQFQPKADSGIEPAEGTMSTAWADIDGDGDLDLYIANYKVKSVLDLFNIKDLAWEKTVKQTYNPDIDQDYTLLPPYDQHYTIIHNEDELPGRREIGRRDVLYINKGDGSFEKANNLDQRFLDSEGNPAGLDPDFGLMAKFHDINQDGRPDLYVCNDYWTQDRFWINQGKGIFKKLDPLAMRNMSFASMSVDFSDINRDGAWDFFVTEMLSPNHKRRMRQFIPDDPYPEYIGAYDNQPQYNRNSLYLNRGDNTFAEIAYYSGVEASEWSWASRFLDVDLDGYEDLLINTGYTYDVQDLDAQDAWKNEIARANENRSFIDLYPSLQLPNKIFRNKNGTTFEDVSGQWGFKETDISHGLATADLDHDGDLDLVVNRLNSEAALYENRAAASRIAVRLIGTALNTQAIGAKVKLLGGSVIQMDEVSAGGEYLSSSDPLLVFAASKSNARLSLQITWPSGQQSLIDRVKANRIYEIDQATISKASDDEKTDSKTTFFTDVSEKLHHTHHEEPYDDFRVQPLLPEKLSRLGPGISWIDYDSDGDDDLFVGSGRGGSLGIYENRNGAFVLRPLKTITQKSRADQTTILGWKENNQMKLTVGYANYEPGDINYPSARSYSLSETQMIHQDSIPGKFSTTGPLAASDYDGDGDLDLFVGGRFVPAHYPMDASSRLFKNEEGTFVLDETNSIILKQLGLVSGAVFSDYDLDGDQDLICSLEWGPIKLFQNDKGTFSDVTESVGLEQYKGWWNGVATGDFNNDGRPDIIATNRGTNSPYQLNTDHPLKMFYQDFNQDGKVEIVESYYSDFISAYVPRRQMLAYKDISNMLSSQILTNADYAGATLDDILQTQLGRLPSKEINTLSHTLFISNSDGFAAKPLPDEAQRSAAFQAGVADYNNDGNDDLFLSQNFFEVYPNSPRLDAGRGLWLKGDGSGNFEGIPGQESGIKVYGQQRGASLSDFNRDGKVDLAISQNGADTKLYKNQTTKTGISVQLNGPASNTNGIGSSVRLVYSENKKGPVREIQAGSGYWSQNSVRQVMGYSKTPAAIEVRWFDGKRDTVNIVPGQMKYSINY